MDFRALLLGTVFAAMWSSAFATARVIVAHAPPLAALSVRFLISGLLAVIVARALGAKLAADRAHCPRRHPFRPVPERAYLGLNFTAVQWVEASLAVDHRRRRCR
jgi:probable blue pigment (indigoidine) exporter